MTEKKNGADENEIIQEGQIVPVIIDEPEKKKKPPKPPSKNSQAWLQKVGLSLLFLLIGLLIATLVLYLPAASSLRETQSELSNSQAEVERLTLVEEQLVQLQEQYAQVSSQLGIYKTISNLGLLESALLSGDSTRVSQQLRYVEDNLNSLQMSGFADIQQRLASQFRKVRAASVSNTPEALKELLVLREDLRLFAEQFD